MHNNNINVTPKLVKVAIWGIAGIVLFVIALAFIRPWYNVWSPVSYTHLRAHET